MAPIFFFSCVDSSIFAAVARVVLDDLGAQAVGVDVGVYLRGAYVFVAEHALDDAQVGTALEQVGGRCSPTSALADSPLTTDSGL